VTATVGESLASIAIYSATFVALTVFLVIMWRFPWSNQWFEHLTEVAMLYCYLRAAIARGKVSTLREFAERAVAAAEERKAVLGPAPPEGIRSSSSSPG
jgi:hypothetical protein